MRRGEEEITASTGPSSALHIHSEDESGAVLSGSRVLLFMLLPERINKAATLISRR